MQVILLDKISKLGNLGDVVRVRDGYARNFLIPKGFAKRATQAAISEFEQRRKELEKLAEKKLTEAKKVGDLLSGKKIKIQKKAGVDGRLFGSVTGQEIVDILEKENIKILKSQVSFKDGPIKVIGEHTVRIALHSEVLAEINVSVVADSQEETT